MTSTVKMHLHSLNIQGRYPERSGSGKRLMGDPDEKNSILFWIRYGKTARLGFSLCYRCLEPSKQLSSVTMLLFLI